MQHLDCTHSQGPSKAHSPTAGLEGCPSRHQTNLEKSGHLNRRSLQTCHSPCAEFCKEAEFESEEGESQLRSTLQLSYTRSTRLSTLANAVSGSHARHLRICKQTSKVLWRAGDEAVPLPPWVGDVRSPQIQRVHPIPVKCFSFEDVLWG